MRLKGKVKRHHRMGPGGSGLLIADNVKNTRLKLIDWYIPRVIVIHTSLYTGYIFEI